MSTTKVSMTINGKKVSADVEPRTLLVQYIREHIGLTGTHVGCDTTQCGCCTIHLNGESVKSCTVLAVQCEGSEVTTIEGLASPDGELHPMQKAFWEHHGLQCGFCTPGMVMVGCDIGRRIPDADEKTIRHELEGNLCRCTGYEHIVEAIHDGIRNMASAKR